MKKILLSFSLIISALDAATIIVLKGTCCAGKTSIFHEIAQKTTWKIVDEDALYLEQSIALWQDIFPEEYAIIKNSIDGQNIFHAVKRNQILFKAGISSAEKIRSLSAIETLQKAFDDPATPQSLAVKTWHDNLKQALSRQIEDYAQAGHTIIVDSWRLSRNYFETLKDSHTVFFVLAYVPLSTIIERVFERNYSALFTGDLRSMRFYGQTLSSFSSLYAFSPENDSTSLDGITPLCLQDTLNLIECILPEIPSISAGPFSRREYSRQDLYDYEESILNYSDVSEQHKFVVLPKEKYDLILYTDQQSPAACTQQLIEFTKSY
jgi:gluconate kinase